ncbi:MAG: hypothetical protein M1542_08410 [Thermotogae bacterium]|jgi:hypothetical protein|nr:hypothetical protein [Thermotogota bacterium]
MGLKTIGELGKIADHITQILTKREYQLDKDEKKRLTIIRDQLNLFISDYMFKDEK